MFFNRPLLLLLHGAIHFLLLARRFLHLHAGLVDSLLGYLDFAEGFQHGGSFNVFVESHQDVAAVFDEQSREVFMVFLANKVAAVCGLLDLEELLSL